MCSSVCVFFSFLVLIVYLYRFPPPFFYVSESAEEDGERIDGFVFFKGGEGRVQKVRRCHSASPPLAARIRRPRHIIRFY